MTLSGSTCAGTRTRVAGTKVPLFTHLGRAPAPTLTLVNDPSALHELAGFAAHVAHPHVTVTRAPSWVSRDRDIEVPVRDGTILRIDVYRDDRVDEPRPVIMCAHPYGKDNLPRRRGPVWLVSPQYRVFRLPEPVELSEYTGWEAPDPVFWIDQGYTVVNVDLRGAGTSDGLWNPLSDQEGEDVADVVDWVGEQPWCDGNVGLLGVSYLAISQYRAAALGPVHLKAICPWEGFTDLYRDFARPGGIQEDGFLTMWTRVTAKATRTEVDLLAEVQQHDLDDDFYRTHGPRLEDITVPMLVCGSFSDHLLHSRGSHEAFRRAGSRDKWLWTHRGGKWSTFYSDEAKADQLAFFDHFLKGKDNGWDRRPRVRLTTHDAGDVTVEEVESFPPPDVRFTPLFLTADATLATERTDSGMIPWSDRAEPLTFTWTVSEETVLSGPMELDLHVTSAGADADVIAAVGHWRDGQRIGYEGSYGFAHDHITHGMVRASQREVDEEATAIGAPVLTHRSRQALAPGEPVRLRVPLLPSSTRLRAGDELVLELHSSWFWPHNPVTGQFPARYVTLDDPQPLTILTGSQHPSALIVPRRT